MHRMAVGLPTCDLLTVFCPHSCEPGINVVLVNTHLKQRTMKHTRVNKESCTMISHNAFRCDNERIRLIIHCANIGVKVCEILVFTVFNQCCKNQRACFLQLYFVVC